MRQQFQKTALEIILMAAINMKNTNALIIVDFRVSADETTGG